MNNLELETYKIQELANIEKRYISLRQKYINENCFDNVQGTKPIIKDGGVNSPIMVIARDLGADEVEQKIPLIGASGKIFRKVIEHFGLKDKIYITNLVPYKPTNNKVFDANIRQEFLKILKQQIEIISPEVILTLGKESYESMLGVKIYSLFKTMEQHYKNGNLKHKILDTNVEPYLLPMGHPSYFVRKGINIKNVISKEDPKELVYFFKKPIELAAAIVNKCKDE